MVLAGTSHRSLSPDTKKARSTTHHPPRMDRFGPQDTQNLAADL